MKKYIICFFLICSANFAQTYSSKFAINFVWASYMGIVLVPDVSSIHTRTIGSISHLTYKKMKNYSLEIRICNKYINKYNNNELIIRATKHGEKDINLLVSESVNFLLTDEIESYYYEINLDLESKGWFLLELGSWNISENGSEYFNIFDKRKVYFAH